jgi:o-succinylbenzoate synthase
VSRSLPGLRLEIKPYALPLRRPFRTSRGELPVREGIVVRLSDDGGGVGYGDAAPLPLHDGESLAAVRDALAVLADRLAEDAGPLTGGAVPPPGDLAAWVDRLRTEVPATRAAWAAVDLALNDLAARRAGLPLARWWHRGALRHVPVNALIGVEEPEEAAEQARTALVNGFGTLKLKIGTGRAMDLARVAMVRHAVGPAAAIRLDANGAWQEDEARAILAELAAFRPEYVEQPVPGPDIEALARLRTAGGVAVAADEALAEPDGARRVLEARAADVLTLKPTLLGGPTVTRALAQQAAAAGVDVVVTGALDSAVGRAGALHVAASLVRRPRAAGLATEGLLVGDVAEGPHVRSGVITVGKRAGLGIEVAGPFSAPTEAEGRP